MKQNAHVLLLDKFSEHKSVILHFANQKHIFLHENNIDSYVLMLNQMEVTKLSRFESMTWDYNKDVPQPAKNVKGAKLRIDFHKYSYIPSYIIIEIKCLLNYLVLNSIAFSKDSKKAKRLKPNTAIAQFEAGLRFLNHVFFKLSEEAPLEFVHDRYQTLSDILEVDFKNAAKDFPYSVSNEFRQFISYLKHPFTSKILGSHIQVDFDALEFPEKQRKKRKASLVFENEVFEKLVRHSTFLIIDFLRCCEIEINDKLALSHLNALGSSVSTCGITKELLNDYAVLRLFRKGYPESEIVSLMHINSHLYSNGSSRLTENFLRNNISIRHRVNSTEQLRRKINEIYDACCYIVAQFTGMRPNALSEIITHSCIESSEGDDLIVSEEKKGKSESFGLFDDRYVTIPLIKDAVNAAKLISKCRNNPYLFCNADTVAYGAEPEPMGSTGIKHAFEKYFVNLFSVKHWKELSFTPYMYRHTLAYQLYRVDLGLPFISYQLKHVVDSVSKYSGYKGTSSTTLGYGELAERLSSDATKGERLAIKTLAEIESVKSTMDPDATYLGKKGKEHKDKLTQAFIGYRLAGYSDDEVYEAMAEQGMAIVNVGSGFCFGDNTVEEFDDSLPCLGGLRCNPIRCKNAIVTKAHAPKWREIYLSNRALVGKEGYEDKQEQILAAMSEAKAVLQDLGEELIVA
ncbi:site-specific integrase [Vibrio parahaemolyticus]|uniref:site-specific integrase n=1 Tax=Vibrio parahaemolyticus TaxID=670 RepID=UPI00215C4CDD|nr:site-specific integrase [Vibrio parahaemolyticus]MCR9712329.1 site-specific integrase [Vibrio parahaemolyticus]